MNLIKNQSQITTADVINLIVVVVFGSAIFKQKNHFVKLWTYLKVGFVVCLYRSEVVFMI